MDRIVKGYAYSLKHLMDIEGYSGYILACGRSDFKKPYYTINFGMKRELTVYEEEVYLILEGAEGILIEKLEYPGCRLSEYLRRKGIGYRIIAEYDKHRRSSFRPAWEYALTRRRACFSENGYALQYYGWADYTYYQFELNFKTSGWMLLEGHDIAEFKLWYVCEDIMGKAETWIDMALLKPQKLSGEQLADIFKKAGLEDEIKRLQMFEREV